MVTTTLSSKGQLIIPAEIRENHMWEKGTRVNIQDTEEGVFIFEVPSKPLMALRGKFKNLDISYKDVKRMRQRDEERDKIK